MADHPEMRTDGVDGSGMIRRSGRGPIFVLAGLIVLIVAGGWAYDHRAEYRAAYGQMFKEVSVACQGSPGGCSYAVADEGPGCCHDEAGCVADLALAFREPVEAPKPGVELSEAIDALLLDESSL